MGRTSIGWCGARSDRRNTPSSTPQCRSSSGSRKPRGARSGAPLRVRRRDRDQDQQDPERERPRGHAIGPRTEPLVHRCAADAAVAGGRAVELRRAAADLHGAPAGLTPPRTMPSVRAVRRRDRVVVCLDRRELAGVGLTASDRLDSATSSSAGGALGAPANGSSPRPQLVVRPAGAQRLVAAGELLVGGGRPGARGRRAPRRRSRSRSCGGRRRRRRAGRPGAGGARTGGPACGRRSPRPRPSRPPGGAVARLGAAPRCRGRRRPCPGPRESAISSSSRLTGLAVGLAPKSGATPSECTGRRLAPTKWVPRFPSGSGTQRIRPRD